MPYIPPNSNQIQPIAIPISRTHQLAIDNIPTSTSTSTATSNESSESDIHTPRPDESSQNQSQPIPVSAPSKESSVDSITSGMTSTSLYSNIPTPPLEHYDSGRSIGDRTSPAASSVISLPEQDQDQDQANVKTSRSDSSLRRRQQEVNEAEEEEEGKKVSGEDVVQSDLDTNVDVDVDTTLNANPNTISISDEDRTAFDLYRQGLYAYTHTLWIQAKLSSSRAERRRQSVSTQFGAKQSGMEKMAAKKALAKRLNG
ncbi:hypothetical protein I302_101109 [Kwoniella bestiolae CBS 10118]|uniref:Uncharacterized protein n=1 Tax=Kwoniella bestiolae CBS 10118 TaxID=1296100 RepID=A0A1B9G6X8_9TREE|nr:hypothetical protein I302_04484 [Kwoniella bestiolae CBS 10118]OCF26794.1 hypothetical protein I302_04484 [Kwoniella bestiolae CBS 10118]